MKIEYNEFIGLYRDVYPEGFCQHLIKEFNILEATGAGYDRKKSENTYPHIKNDLSININLTQYAINDFNNQNPCRTFFDGLQECFIKYTEKFSILKDFKIRANEVKVQRTSPGGGYHVWHCERDEGPPSNRVLVYMLYLNSISKDGGGETEFLYQRQRIYPEENLMIFWPASYTHVHRGNTVLSDEYKYVVTGWFYYN